MNPRRAHARAKSIGLDPDAEHLLKMLADAEAQLGDKLKTLTPDERRAWIKRWRRENPAPEA